MIPHKCPCCDGWCTREVPAPAESTDATPKREPCPACKGTGVVWGAGTYWPATPPWLPPTPGTGPLVISDYDPRLDVTTTMDVVTDIPCDATMEAPHVVT